MVKTRRPRETVVRHLAWLALLLAGVALSPRPALATTFTFQVDDLADSVTLSVLIDGTLTSTTQGPPEERADVFGFSDVVFSGVLAANILEPVTGSLSDTYHVTATPLDGGTSVFLTFHSDTEGGPALTPLPNAVSLTETGDWQTIGTFTFPNGDTLDFQFRSDVEAAPEPSALLLLGSGLAGLAGLAWRRAKRK